MNRRDFILSAAGGLGVVSATTYYFLRDLEYDHSLASPQFLPLIWDAETIKTIGNQYREKFPSEESEQSLVELLLPKPNEDMIVSDFENGKTVVIDGWILSVTEARQCALASTQHS